MKFYFHHNHIFLEYRDQAYILAEHIEIGRTGPDIFIEGNPDILGDLSIAIRSSSGTQIRSHGQASPKLLQRIDYLTKLRDTTDSIKVVRFAERQIKYTKAEIDQELQRDEDLNA